MTADIFPLVLGLLIIISSLISLRLGVSVTIIEIIIGVIAGNLGIIQAEPWMLYIAGFGGILLTFLAGTEIDADLLKDKLKESILLGIASFLGPFVIILLVTYFGIGWDLSTSLLCATALSETSIAVVYSVLVEKGLCDYKIGKLLMVATFITNLCTAVALSVLFMQISMMTVVFYIACIIILLLSYKYSYLILESKIFKNRVNEVEIQYIFVILLAFIFLANLGGSQAILPAFILGAVLSNQLKDSPNMQVKTRMKTLAFAVINPIFFIIAGMRVSIPLILGSIVIFAVIFISRQIAKIIGVYGVSSYCLDENKEYMTLMLSTGLTFGLIAAVYGLDAGLINQTVYSILTGVLVLSAVLPSFIAEKWFKPVLN